jgi:hypothetical protein
MKTAEGFREIRWHRCGNCAMIVYENGSTFCRRPNGPSWDTGDRLEDDYVCKRWRSRKANAAGQSLADKEKRHE